MYFSKTEMSGIDRQRIVGKSDDELDELICGICQDIFTDPVVTPCCQQTYCTLCINQWLVNHNTCPNDREHLTMEGLMPSARVVINILNKLSIKCENYLKGCEVVLTIEEMKEHIKTCHKNCDNCKKSKALLTQKTIIINKKEDEIAQLKAQLKSIESEIKVMKIKEQEMSKSLSEVSF